MKTNILASAAVRSGLPCGAPFARPGWLITASTPSRLQGISVFADITLAAAAGDDMSAPAAATRPATAVDHATRVRETKQPYPGPPRDQLQT